MARSLAGISTELGGPAQEGPGGAAALPLLAFSARVAPSRRLGGEIEVERRAPHREIGFGFGFVSCVRARRSCVGGREE